MRSRFVVRVRLLSAIFILGAIILIGRLYQVQVVLADKYRGDAEDQYVLRAQDIEERGTIFFSPKGGVPTAAAQQQSGWRVAIDPRVIEDPDAAYERLSAAAPLDRERFFSAAEKKSSSYKEVAFRMSDEEASAVRSLGEVGVQTVRDAWRVYPAGDLAAHAVGFVGYQGDRRTGVYGLERYWNDTLERSRSGLYVNPFAELFADVGALMSDSPNAHTGDIITSIEPNVQQELQSTLGSVMEQYLPDQAGGIIMDPKTGEISALAVLPEYDPNTYNTVEDPGIFANPLVERVYEMGSIMKALTMAAGIDAGAVTPDTTYTDKGYVMKSGKRISNYDGRGRGVVSMQEVLNQSLNTGVSFVVDKMGKEPFAKYMKAYGLGEETGIDLPGEVAGKISALDGSADVDFASASFGQGIAVTPIEMIRALSALGNGGRLAEPHLVKAVRYESGITRSVSTPPQKQVLSPEAAEDVTRMLVKVYDDALLGGELKMDGYSIAAKTGTAQIAKASCGGYCEGVFLHSFFGYFPAHDPRWIVLLYAVEPQREMYASHTLARPFASLAKFLLTYYDVPPDRGASTGVDTR